MSSSMSRIVRLRMTRTGEKYTTALRAIEADPEEATRLRAVLRSRRQPPPEPPEPPEPRQLQCPDDADHGLQPVTSLVREGDGGVNSYRLACLHVAVISEGDRPDVS